MGCRFEPKQGAGFVRNGVPVAAVFRCRLEPIYAANGYGLFDMVGNVKEYFFEADGKFGTVGMHFEEDLRYDPVRKSYRTNLGVADNATGFRPVRRKGNKE